MAVYSNAILANVLTQVLKSLASKSTLFAIVVTLAASAQAAPVYETPVGAADFTGTRVYQDEGLDGQATISWEITPGINLFTYRYTLSIPNVDPGPTPFFDASHFSLDVSDNFFSGDDDIDVPFQNQFRNTIATNAIESALLAEPPFDPFSEMFIDFGDFDGITGAVKFDFGGGKPELGVINTTNGLELFYEFTVPLQPVWGNYAIKSDLLLFQSPAIVAGTVFTSENTDDFIPVPNSIVPEPSSFVLAALGLCMLLGFRRRRSA